MRTLLYNIALCVTASSLFADESKTWNVRDHIPLQEITVQAHRGAGVLAPENSLEAFEIAWKLGVIPEADIRMTKDGVIVSFHDNDFSRILPTASEEMKKKGIKDLTYKEVAKLDIGAWKGREFEGQRIPSMGEIADVLKKHPQRKIYVDIKNVDFEQLARETQGIHSQMILASTKYEEIELWKKAAPKSFTLHWMGGTEEQLTERLKRLDENSFRGIDQLQIHVRINKEGGFEPGEDFLKKTGDMLREYGILFQVLPWEGKEPAVYRRLLNLGVASFATDYPDVTMQAIVEHYAQ
jgi:glycerophosphoryl diester phosphodiesterase